MASSALNQNISSGLSGHIAAFCIFDGKAVGKTLSVEDFESLAEHEAPLNGYNGKVHAAYVIANQSQFIQSIVLFILPLDENGFVIEGWRIPLERLSNTANRGPNLGGGRIRLSCHSQCSISWHQDNLWDPGARHFSEIKKAMGQYLAEFDDALVSMDLAAVSETDATDQLLDVDQLRRELRNESATYRNELQALQQEVERQRLLNERLIKQTQSADEPKPVLPKEDKVDLHVLRRQNELLNMKIRELQVSNEKLRLETAAGGVEESDIDAFIEKMAQQEMMTVVYHHGVGHINLTSDHIVEYLEDPMAYAANHINISKLQYRRWLEHEEKPKCHVCDDELVAIVDPSAFNFEKDVYCGKHKP